MKRPKFSKQQIAELNKIGVEIIYLFGSRTQGYLSPLSDFDFGIVLEKPERYRKKTLEIYLKLYEIFSDLLPKKYLKKRFKIREHEFDIVFLQFAPISLQFEVISTGKVIYEKSIQKRFDYQEYVMKRYADLQHFYNLRYKAILERI